MRKGQQRKHFGTSNSQEQGIDCVNDLIEIPFLLSWHRKVEAISIL
jgi:hypothetical protein